MQPLIIDNLNIMRIEGEMAKYFSPWGTQTGMDELSMILTTADRMPAVKAHVLIINSPGGAVESLAVFSNSLQEAKKPVFAIVEGCCESAAYYVASMCKKIYAIHDMNEIGSIGVFAQLQNDENLNEYFGIKTITVYPKESSLKNLPERELLQGKPNRYRDEKLSPAAQHFQEIVSTFRPQILTTSEKENILAGKSYYAKDALKYRLIDGIHSPARCIELIKEELG